MTYKTKSSLRDGLWDGSGTSGTNRRTPGQQLSVGDEWILVEFVDGTEETIRGWRGLILSCCEVAQNRDRVPDAERLLARLKGARVLRESLGAGRWSRLH